MDDTIVENICENMDKEDCQEVTKIVQDEECSKVIKQKCSNVQETNCSVIGSILISKSKYQFKRIILKRKNSIHIKFYK